MTMRYTRDHEWIRLEGDIATIGITDYAQEQLGDIVFVELPAVGKQLDKGGEVAVVESVKAASEVYAPVAGVIAAANSALAGEPAAVNTDPEGAGWFVRIKVANVADVEALMTIDAYQAFLQSI